MSEQQPRGGSGEALSCDDRGRGAALTLVHGVGLDRSMWEQHARALCGEYRVLCPDLPGHGRSPPLGVATPTLAALAASLSALLGRLGVERTALVGFSLGALVAQRFACDYPQQVSHLVLLSSVCERSAAQREAVAQRVALAESEGGAALVEAALERWFSPRFAASEPGVIEAVRARLLANDPRGFLPAYRLFADADRELEGLAARIEAPTLVMTGELDPGSTPAMSRRLADLIQGAQLRIVPGARHMLPVEFAALTIAAIRDFLHGAPAPDDEAST